MAANMLFWLVFSPKDMTYSGREEGSFKNPSFCS